MTAWAAWGGKAKAAGSAADDFAAKLASLTNDTLGLTLARLRSEMIETTARLQDLRDAIKGTSGREFADLFRRIGDGQKYLNELNRQIRETEAQVREKPKPLLEETSPEKALSVLKARAEAAAKVASEALARQQRDLDAQLEQHLVSYRDYYRRKQALQEQAIDVEIRATQAELDAQRQALEAAQKDKDRAGILDDIAKLEGELTVLRSQRAEVAVTSAREQAKAEQDLADTLIGLRAKLAENQGDTVTARMTEVVAQYRDTLATMVAEGNQAGIDIITALFQTEAAKAQLEVLQRDWDAAMQRMSVGEDRINTARENGVITEVTARRELLKLHQDAYQELVKLLPLMEAAARQAGPEAERMVAQFRHELEGTAQVVDEVARRINDAFRSSLTDALDSIGEKSIKVRDLLLDVVRAARRVAAENLADAITTKLDIGGKVSGLFGKRDGSTPANALYVQGVGGPGLPGLGGESGAPGAPDTAGLWGQAKLWVGDLLGQAREWLSGLGSALGNLFGSIGQALAGTVGGTGGGFDLGSLASMVVGLFHGGGLVGSPAMSREVSAALFHGARRLHSGNTAEILGLRPGEFPAILQGGANQEEVLTRSDPRHVLNGGLQGSGPRELNARFTLVDDRSQVENTMMGPAGERAVTLHIKRNATTYRRILGLSS